LENFVHHALGINITTPALAGEKYNGPACAAGWNEVIDLFVKSIS
jgi:hypothetical protein